uniref:Uncharacterized protein n=1 Tax=Rhizophora mucronata TaxID=61149 RepID=A0A2P2PFS8_RHIMU
MHILIIFHLFALSILPLMVLLMKHSSFFFQPTVKRFM